MNIYGLSGLLIAVTSGLMTLLMFFIAKRKLHYLWATFCFSVFLFGIGIYFVAGATTPEAASFWWRISHIGAILIPVLFLHFVYEFLEIKKTKILFFLYTVSIILLVTDLTGGLFINKMRFAFDQFYYDSPPEPFYVLFTIMFFGLTTYSHFLLWLGYKKSKDILIKNKIKFFFFGMGVSFAGGAFNFLPVYGIDIYPYMNMTVFLYPLIISYAIFKHQLFDIKLVLVELAILLLNLFLLFNAFTSYGKADFIINISVFLFIALFSVVLMHSINKDIRDREKIEGLVEDMEIANEKLRAMEVQKTEFVSIASHQLRTPLTVIKGYASMILEGTFGQLSNDSREAMEKLNKSVQKVVLIVEDLLTVSRIEQGRMTFGFVQVNFSDFVNAELDELKNDAIDAQVDMTFKTEGDAEALASIDEQKFKQVVRHIIENAIQYTKAGGLVRVEVQGDKVAKKVRLLVSDTGVGMTPEQISAILDKQNLNVVNLTIDEDARINGQRIKDETNKLDFLPKITPGIGLYIAEEIIKAHHGTVSVKSDGLGKGTTVIVELPGV